MRHIKNFFHNITDVLLAIIIVAIAAGIIFWRMQVILDYPKTVVSNQTVTEDARCRMRHLLRKLRRQRRQPAECEDEPQAEAGRKKRQAEEAPSE